MRLIAFAGRKCSGKGELAKVCEKEGFTVIRFASALKELCSKVMGITIDETQESKTIEVNHKVNEEDLSLIFNETGISIEDLRDELGGMLIRNGREALQVIGTDVIRKYRPNWHVNKLKDTVLSDMTRDYVVEDMRFPNEMECVKDLGGESWFVVRPTLEFVSNHESETALCWQDFEEEGRIIVNGSYIHDLTDGFKEFIGPYHDEIMEKRKELFDWLFEQYHTRITEEEILDKLAEKEEQERVLIRSSLRIFKIPLCIFSHDKHMFEQVNFVTDYNGKTFVCDSGGTSFTVVNGTLYHKHDGQYEAVTSNALAIENLKKWL